MKEELYFNSASGKNKIHGVIYAPEGEVKAILQISHGMQEYIERYENFASFLNEKGIAVGGNDHLGHGATAVSDDELGYFADENGNAMLLADNHRMTQILKERFPGKPLFLLGHSMGSFYVRQYLFSFGDELDGAIIMGTGHQPLAAAYAGMALTKLIALFKGWHGKSEFMNDLVSGKYNERFSPAETGKEWLTKDKTIVDKYVHDPHCMFYFTLNGYYNMLLGISRLHNQKLVNKMPKKLPVLFVSGADDPVGDYTKGVKAAVKTFEKAGMENVTVRFYPGDRHEILNELDRASVYNDIYTWMGKVSAL